VTADQAWCARCREKCLKLGAKTPASIFQEGVESAERAAQIREFMSWVRLDVLDK